MSDPCLSPKQNQNALQDLRLQRGTRESRRTLRQGLRAWSHDTRFRDGSLAPHEYNLIKATQISTYVPYTDRAVLSTMRESIFERSKQIRQREEDNLLLSKFSDLKLSPARIFPGPGLMDLAQEIREQIYGYILPVYVQDKFLAKGCDIYTPDKPTRQIEKAYGSLETMLYRNRGGTYSTSIMRVNKKIYCEASSYLFRDCTIRIRVDETGYSFLEHKSCGVFLAAEDGTKLTTSKFGMNVPSAFPSYETRDRFTEWHQSFVAMFDFSLPKRLILSIEAPDYQNPEGVLQITQSMMTLCNVLRKCSRIKEIQVEPQSLEYRHTASEIQNRDEWSTTGSYFVWQWQRHNLPPYQPAWHHKCGPKRFRFKKEATWAGGLRGLLFEKRPDLELVLQPLCTLRNVREASIKHPRTEPQHAAVVKRQFDCLCASMKGQGTFTVKKEMARHRELVKECQRQLKLPEARAKVKKARRTKAKDLWYWWHCETCGEEFTEHGELGYDSDDEPDW